MTPETLVAIGGVITALLAGATGLVAKRGETTARQMAADRRPCITNKFLFEIL